MVTEYESTTNIPPACVCREKVASSCVCVHVHVCGIQPVNRRPYHYRHLEAPDRTQPFIRRNNAEHAVADAEKTKSKRGARAGRQPSIYDTTSVCVGKRRLSAVLWSSSATAYKKMSFLL